MGKVIDMTTQLKIKKVINKNLTGREIASVLLEDIIQRCHNLTRVFSDAETQNMFNSLKRRPHEYSSFNKWIQLEKVIMIIDTDSDFQAVSAASNLNLIISKFRSFEIRWVIHGCEEEWETLLKAHNQKLGINVDSSSTKCPTLFSFQLQPSTETRQLEFIKALYQATRRHLRRHMACKALRDIIADIMHIDLSVICTESKDTLSTSLAFFNMAFENQLYSEYLAETHPNVTPILPIAAIDEIGLEDYAPPSNLIEKVRIRIEDASADTLLETCAECLEMLSGE
jgi:hypothetical protein